MRNKKRLRFSDEYSPDINGCQGRGSVGTNTKCRIKDMNREEQKLAIRSWDDRPFALLTDETDLYLAIARTVELAEIYRLPST